MPIYSAPNILTFLFLILVSIFIVTFSGCASEYQTSEMLSMKKSIDRPKALNIFSSVLSGSEDASGLCAIYGLGGGSQSGKSLCTLSWGCYGYERRLEGNPIISDAGISFKAWKLGKFIGNEIYQKEYFPLQIKFENIEKARVLEKNINVVSDDDYCKGNYIISIQYKIPEEIAKSHDINPYVGIADIRVSNKHDIDKLLGSLSLLSPQVRIIKGFGF